MPDFKIEAEWRRAVRDALIEQRLTHKALAERMGIDRTQITNTLNGSRSKIPASIVELLDAVGLELVVRPKRQE